MQSAQHAAYPIKNNQISSLKLEDSRFNMVSPNANQHGNTIPNSNNNNFVPLLPNVKGAPMNQGNQGNQSNFGSMNNQHQVSSNNNYNVNANMNSYVYTNPNINARPGYASPATTSSTNLSAAAVSGATRNDDVSLLAEKFEATRKRATTQSHDPTVQLEYAKALMEASETLTSWFSDPVTYSPTRILNPTVISKNRDVWQSLALKIIKKLATRTMYPEAIFSYASLYSSGSCGLDTDNAKAFELYEKAAKLDNSNACYRVAVCLEFGVGVNKSIDKATQWYERAANLGNTSSMYKLGMLALQGALNQPRDFRSGFSWLQKAASQADAKNPHALHEIALLYEHSPLGSYATGDPLPLNYEAAFQNFLQAAKLNYAPAQTRLAKAYEFGDLQLQINPSESIYWYSQAAKLGDTEAQLGLAGWYWTGSPSLRRNDTEAFVWAERAATKGNIRAQFCLGYFYEIGVGVHRDLEKAKLWYTRAAQRKHSKAEQRLKSFVFA